jgi:DNA-binding CsgD family transcriptional regulator
MDAREEERLLEVGMSTLLPVECPATERSTSTSFPSNLKLLFCGPDGRDCGNLGLLNTANVCTIDIHSAEELSSAVAATTPDLIVLSLEALRRVLPNQTISFNAAEDLEYALSGLHPRQADIIRMLAKGLRNHEIGATLGLSSRTVKAILSSLYLRYDVTNRTELLGLLMEQGHLAAPQLHLKPGLEQGGQLNSRPTLVRRSQRGSCG